MDRLFSVILYIFPQDRLEKINAELTRQKKVIPTDQATIQIGDLLLADNDNWHSWWRDFRNSIPMKKSAPKGGKKGKSIGMLSLASGNAITPLERHLAISGLKGVGGGIEDRLVCFDKDSFQSFGLAEATNSAMSEDEVAIYRASLNDLLEKSSHRLAGAKVAYWFAGMEPLPDENPLPWVIEGMVRDDDPDEADSEESSERVELDALHRARKLLASIQSGEKADLRDGRYYALTLTLSGASGRVMIRDWMDGKFEELLVNVLRWFDDLAIANIMSTGKAKTPKIENVITSLLSERKPSQKYEDWIKPIGQERNGLWYAALTGNCITSHILTKVVIQHNNFVRGGKAEEALKKERNWQLNRSLLYIRMGLIKAFHVRLLRKAGMKEEEIPVKEGLNPEFEDPAYQCGRLTYTLAAMQRLALPDVQAGVIQRYYSGVSASPGLHIGRLIALSNHHLEKALKDDRRKKRAYWLEKEKSSILNAVSPESLRQLTSNLNFEKQSLFALGYYHQMASDRGKFIAYDQSEPQDSSDADQQ